MFEMCFDSNQDALIQKSSMKVEVIFFPLFYSLIHNEQPDQCLEHKGYSINIFSMKKFTYKMLKIWNVFSFLDQSYPFGLTYIIFRFPIFILPPYKIYSCPLPGPYSKSFVAGEGAFGFRSLHMSICDVSMSQQRLKTDCMFLLFSSATRSYVPHRGCFFSLNLRMRRYVGKTWSWSATRVTSDCCHKPVGYDDCLLSHCNLVRAYKNFWRNVWKVSIS